jgi:hypothetical protein
MIAKQPFLPETLLLVLVVVLVLEKHAYTHRWEFRVRLFRCDQPNSIPKGFKDSARRFNPGE